MAHLNPPIPHSMPWIVESDHDAINQVLKSGMLAQGEMVAEFERQVSAYVGAIGGVAVASGSAALELALRALGVGNGKEVIIPTYVCRSVAEAIISVGATPVLCDIGTDWNMTVDTVAARVTSETAAIVVVHIFGVPAGTEQFKQFGLPIIEDCCQAFGATDNNAICGGSGVIGFFSFHATKCLTTGEGGMAVTGDPAILDRMRTLRDELRPGCGRVHSPLSDFQASLGLSQFSRYSEFLERRSAIAHRYFAEMDFASAELPNQVQERSMFFRFPVLSRFDFDVVRAQFQSYNISVRRGVDKLLHREWQQTGVRFPIADRIFERTVSVPIYPSLSDSDVDRIISVSQRAWAS